MERFLKGLKPVAAKSSNEAEDSKAVRPEDAAIPDQDGDATSTTSTSSFTDSKAKKRKYDESYMTFGFVDSNGSSLSMLCSKLLSNSSMVPAKMRRHLETVHPEYKDKEEEFFLRKKTTVIEKSKNYDTYNPNCQ